MGIDGFVAVSSTTKPPLPNCPPLEITTLYVQPRHQSSGRGVALLYRALDHCRSMGSEIAWLKVNAENGRAIRFYLRNGFSQIGSTHFVIADRTYENHVMKTELAGRGGLEPTGPRFARSRWVPTRLRTLPAHRDPILQRLRLSRRDQHQAGLVGKRAVESSRAGEAAPRLDAQERRA